LGFAAARAYNHDLLWRGVALIGGRRAGRATSGDPAAAAPEAMSGSMTALPLPEAFGRGAEDARRLRASLLFEHSIEVQVSAWHDRLWMRLSAQVYNEMGDFERLAGALDSLRGR
jgi:isopenicillin-N epimerase